MLSSTSELTFTWTPAALAFGAGVSLVVAAVGFLIWKRSGFSAFAGLLELLRLAVVVLVALTLNQPEWRRVFHPEDEPVVAVLVDESGSMETADVVDPDDPSAPPRLREEVARPFADPASWESLGEKAEVWVRPFSSDGAGGGAGSGGTTDIAGALDAVAEDFSNLRAVILASDGDWNEGEPPARAAARLRMREVPVFAVPVGSGSKLPDVEAISFDAPTFAIAGKAVRVPFAVESSLPQDRSVTVEMKSDRGDTLSRTITLPAMGTVRDAFLWKPQETGEQRLTLEVPVSKEEWNEENNRLEAPITVREEELRVLLIESYPRWEYRYLRNALERDPGVEVRTLLFHPDVEAAGGGKGYLDSFPGPEELARFDVVVLGDVGIGSRQLDPEQAARLVEQVATQAGGLVFLPGFRGHQHSLIGTGLEELLPVVLDEAQPRGWGSSVPGQFELTDLGLRSLLTRLEDSEDGNARVWGSLPGFQWFAGVERARAGAEVLATHSSESNRYGRIPLIVTRTYGAGKVLYMATDGAWRWRKGVEDKYHYRFWGQVARWMAYQRHMASGNLVRLFYSPDRPRAGGTLTLNANAMSPGGEPLAEAAVVARITAPSGRVESLRLRSGGEEQRGLFTAAFTPEEGGDHLVELSCAENGASMETAIAVQGEEREKVGQPARYEVLREISRISQGALVEGADLEAALARITALPEPRPEERRLRIWAHPLWIGFLVLLLGIFWVGRKMAGAV